MSVDITRIGMSHPDIGAPGPGVREQREYAMIIDLFDKKIITRAEARTAFGLSAE